MIELAALAASIVSSFLVPLVKDGAKTLRDRLATKAGESTADTLVNSAETLWTHVKGAAKPGDEQSVVGIFEKNPDLVMKALEQIVHDQLERDPAFRQQANKLLEAEVGAGQTSWRIMGETVGVVDARGANISGGQVAGIVMGARDPGLEASQKNLPPE